MYDNVLRKLSTSPATLQLLIIFSSIYKEYCLVFNVLVSRDMNQSDPIKCLESGKYIPSRDFSKNNKKEII